MSIRKVTIAICTYNRAACLDEAIRSVAEAKLPGGLEVEIIVVDNNSTDDTWSVICEHARHLPLVGLREARQGLGFARNRAIEAASGDLMLWTDDDVLVDGDWISIYVEAAEAWPAASFFGGAILPRFESSPPRWIRDNLLHLEGPYSLMALDDSTRLLAAGTFIGANMAFRTAVLKDYPFDADLGRAGDSLIGGEDTEIFRRLMQDGHQGVCVGRSRVAHRIGGSRMSLSYIAKWYYGAGKTAARIVALRSGTREAVGYLSELTRAPGQNEFVTTFFSGPLWLRTVKAVAYCLGLRQEAARRHHVEGIVSPT